MSVNLSLVFPPLSFWVHFPCFVCSVCYQLLDFNRRVHSCAATRPESNTRLSRVPPSTLHSAAGSIIINRRLRLLKKQIFLNAEHPVGACLAWLVQRFLWLSSGWGCKRVLKPAKLLSLVGLLRNLSQGWHYDRPCTCGSPGPPN